MSNIAQNIRTVRELKNLTQEYVAEKLHMSVANYSNIESGKTNITLVRLEEIANVLGVDYQNILSLTPSQVFNNSPYSGIISHQENNVHEELIRQLKVKDEQIQKLTDLLEKMYITSQNR
ncbi:MULTISPECIES: helix-turn-helix domain-containing protein [Chitinophagaceae]